MFDKEINVTNTNVEAVTRVVEKTISPDKITDMYKDVREEVIGSILRTLVADNNKMNGVVVEIQQNLANDQRVIYTFFTLNGQEYTHKRTFLRDAEILKSDEQIFTLLFDDYVSAVSKELMKECVLKFKRVR